MKKNEKKKKRSVAKSVAIQEKLVRFDDFSLTNTQGGLIIDNYPTPPPPPPKLASISQIRPYMMATTMSLLLALYLATTILNLMGFTKAVTISTLPGAVGSAKVPRFCNKCIVHTYSVTNYKKSYVQ